MRSITRVSLVIAASAALVGSLALPASAADTVATVTVPAGQLTISAPASADLGTVAPGSPISAALGTVTVSDLRAGVQGWDAQVNMSDFVGTNTATVIAAASATYTPGTAAESGTSTVTPSAQTGLATAKTVQAATGVSGNNTAAWDADLSFTAPADALADTYTATLTHSVL
ncbi:conserved hypothetical protein [Arthrobacter sp. FB24]|jgi:hypothetical protein|uniref:hypothetical protein n=1 Tax=Arthrobacter sp. (strain FB24) TaxID=290399 RepID=UPI000052763A|nr:hypothetical protein [Arthrobacter sp. FB24]ABK03160.1 conserved hypothetical protein [Arthrobacter sp. FB24]